MSTTAPYVPFTVGDIRCMESMEQWSGRYVDDMNIGTPKRWSLRFACRIYMVVGHTPARRFNVN